MVNSGKVQTEKQFLVVWRNETHFERYFLTGIHMNPYWEQMAGPFPCLNSASESEEDYEGRGYATSRLLLPLGHCQAQTL